MQIIDELEPSRRGPYGGAVGYLSYTATPTPASTSARLVKDGRIHVQAGGGIVADSMRTTRSARPRPRPARCSTRCAWRARRETGSDPRGARRPSAGRSSTAASVLVIDNYDLHLQPRPVPGRAGREPEVVRNDEATVDELVARGPGSGDRLAPARRPRRVCRLTGSGPSPSAGRGSWACAWATRRWRWRSAGRVVRGEPVHGKTTEVEHDGRTIFRGLESPVVAGRYHSLVVDPDLPGELEVSAAGLDGMAPPPGAARGGRAVPPRVGPHRRRQGAPAEFPLRMCQPGSHAGHFTGSRRGRTRRPTRRPRCSAT